MTSLKRAVVATAVQTQYGVAVKRPGAEDDTQGGGRGADRSKKTKKKKAAVAVAPRLLAELPPMFGMFVFWDGQVGVGDKVVWGATAGIVLDYLPCSDLLRVACGLSRELFVDTHLRTYLANRVANRKTFGTLDAALQIPGPKTVLHGASVTSEQTKVAFLNLVAGRKITPHYIIASKRSVVTGQSNLRTCCKCRKCKTAYFHLLHQHYICHMCCTDAAHMHVFKLMSIEMARRRYMVSEKQIEGGCLIVKVHMPDTAFAQTQPRRVVLECKVRIVACAVHSTPPSKRTERRQRSHSGVPTSSSAASSSSSSSSSLTDSNLDVYITNLARTKNEAAQAKYDKALKDFEGGQGNTKKPVLKLWGALHGGHRPVPETVLVDYDPNKRTLLANVHPPPASLLAPEGPNAGDAGANSTVVGSVPKPCTLPPSNCTRSQVEAKEQLDESTKIDITNGVFVWVYGGQTKFEARSPAAIKKQKYSRRKNMRV